VVSHTPPLAFVNAKQRTWESVAGQLQSHEGLQLPGALGDRPSALREGNINRRKEDDTRRWFGNRKNRVGFRAQGTTKATSAWREAEPPPPPWALQPSSPPALHPPRPGA
jgi:hypothetical protein